MAIALRNDQGQPDPVVMYYLSSLCRAQYEITDYLAFQGGDYGNFIVPPRIFRDFNNRKRTTALVMPAGTVVASGGLVTLDWPFFLITGNYLVDATGIFAGQVMSPALQVWAWTWPAVQNLINALPASGQMVFTGHSFGGMIATMYAWTTKVNYPSRDIKVVTFGTPSFGDDTFNQACPVPIINIRNFGDVVLQLPNFRSHAAQGEVWHVWKTGQIYPQWPAVLASDGQTVDGITAMRIEQQPRAVRPFDGFTMWGHPDATTMQTTKVVVPDGHASNEYVRRWRRFFGGNPLRKLDALNNGWNVASDIAWRVPMLAASQTIQAPIVGCAQGACSPIVGC